MNYHTTQSSLRIVGFAAIAAWVTCPTSTLEADQTIRTDDGAEMVRVPAGPFMMGTSHDEEHARPPHRVDLPGFYIDKHEVTVEQYARFVEQTGHEPPVQWVDGKPAESELNKPITNISWYDAMAYAIWADKRLPTEAEWEKAARGIDGRVYPWGNEDREDGMNIPGRGISSKHHQLAQVGSLPNGASPYGCLDMAGNAWEWTATWYDAYPGSEMESVHFGRQYKVFRGGGGTGFYGVPNTGKTPQRARLVPYGAHDYLGFRCVKSVDPGMAPYSAKQLLTQAKDQLDATLKKPVTLEYEKAFANLKESGKIPIRVVGPPNQKGAVRAGFPLPEGMIKNVPNIKLETRSGRPVVMQRATLASWPDDSAKWILMDFEGQAGETYVVDLSRENESEPAPGSDTMRIKRSPGAVKIEAEKINLRITPQGLLQHVWRSLEEVLVERLELELTIEQDGQLKTLQPLPAKTVDFEAVGPCRAVIRLSGVFADEAGKSTDMRYDVRLHASAESSQIRILTTISHHADRIRSDDPHDPWGERKPLLNVVDACARFVLPDNVSEAVFGTDTGAEAVDVTDAVTLHQPTELGFAISKGQENLAVGTRAPGWAAVPTSWGSGDEWMIIGMRHFWENYPSAITVAPKAVELHFWAGDEPFDWEAGLAKTQEMVLDLSPSKPEQAHLDPLRVILPPQWACGTAAAGAILPRSSDSLSLIPYWELWREWAMLDWRAGRDHGFRHFGDAYYGGPYKGKNSYQNLEYDIHWNFLEQFLRTGELWLFETAEASARHQADIDFSDYDGQIFKHSPLHTTIEADLGHVFVRGLLLHYLLTGERRSLEMAELAGDWIANEVETALAGEHRITNKVGNERKIGWSLYALTALYEQTGKQKYLQTAERLCQRLIDEQEPTGKFHIEWDNRIAFFNGIAMNGMLTVQEITNDPELAAGILRVAYRTLGVYPEYALRTLNAFCWALVQTNDPRFLDAMERVWHSSMQFFTMFSPMSAETHAWKFPRFAAKYRLCPLFKAGVPENLPESESWNGIRFKEPSAEVFLKRTSEADAPILVVREGLTSGRVDLLDLAGNIVQSRELSDDGRFFEPAVITVPRDQEMYRLRMSSGNAYGWEVHYDRNAALTLCDPEHALLGEMRPRAYGFLENGAEAVTIRFEVEGEGFHTATLYDPAGNPVAATKSFIDLGDIGRYEMELTVTLPDSSELPLGGWSLAIYDAKVKSVEGMRPYWATSEEELFDPERVGAETHSGVPLARGSQ